LWGNPVSGGKEGAKELGVFIEGSFEVKLPTVWTDGKAEVGRGREETKREDQRRERVRRKKMQVREKGEESPFTVFSNDLWLRRFEK